MVMSLICRRGLKMMSQVPKEPLVVVIGSTGTGKSKVIESVSLLQYARTNRYR